MTAIPSLEATFGGIPLVDSAFDSAKFLTAVATTRLFRAGDADTLLAASGQEREHLLGQVLDPARALELRGSHPFRSDVMPLPAEKELEAQDALAQLAHLVPHWRLLRQLRITFHGLQRPGTIGSSNFNFPQHIFLGAEAFQTRTELLEQVLHETSHNWLYLVEEMWPLHRTTGDVLFDLPSGTSNRNPGEVLGAAHVTRNLIALYRALPPSEPTGQRLGDLHDYMAGCCELLEQVAPHLTDVGHEVALRLQSDSTATQRA
ncbi:aKG-HExxH-type peptide beta-hydroxylase [Streptomyces sp. NPDC050485]|uniref:aKG-HExxH-type peptide beta-hydroxylase n=1 Tax=Streptomyces sp. NPDC050485 TaxID=3365617 RepID=UPI0037970C3E